MPGIPRTLFSFSNPYKSCGGFFVKFIARDANVIPTPGKFHPSVSPRDIGAPTEALGPISPRMFRWSGQRQGPQWRTAGLVVVPGAQWNQRFLRRGFSFAAAVNLEAAAPYPAILMPPKVSVIAGAGG
jgi:hypothetical protein